MNFRLYSAHQSATVVLVVYEVRVIVGLNEDGPLLDGLVARASGCLAQAPRTLARVVEVDVVADVVVVNVTNAGFLERGRLRVIRSE